MLTSENKMIKCRNQNMAFLLNVITTQFKSLQIQENIGQKHKISSDFRHVCKILPIPSFICAGKRSGGFKIMSQYFSKMLSIPSHGSY